MNKLIDQILERVKERFSENTGDRDGYYVDENVRIPDIQQFLKTELEDLIEKVREESKWEGKNEYYFNSPEYLTKRAHQLACTVSQRWNENNYNNSRKSFIEEMTRLSNELVSVTKKIRNTKELEK
jgi:hypothetical protein